jgi:acetyl esterase/lipase
VVGVSPPDNGTQFGVVEFAPFDPAKPAPLHKTRTVDYVVVISMKVPVLMLHGTADREADGGTEFTKVEMARSFEQALRTAGKTVEAVYYEGGRHNDIFDSSVRYQDELQRSLVFFGHHLGLRAGTPS